MKDLTTKQLQRIKKKKEKAAAFLRISRLNDKDKRAKLQALKQSTNTGSKSRILSFNDMAEENCNRKRFYNTNLNDIYLEAHAKEDNCDELKLQSNNKILKLSNSEEYAKLKQELRKRKQRLQGIPRLTLKAVGENATLDCRKIGEKIPIFLSDVQHLLLYSLLGHHSPYLPTRWCKLEKYNKISQTVIFVVEGLSAYHFVAYESLFSNIANTSKYHLEVVTPVVYGASITEELVAVPVTGTQCEKLLRRYSSLETALQSNGNVIKLLKSAFPVQLVNTDETVSINQETNKDLPFTDQFCRTKLLLSLWQMVEENYPVPLKGTLAERYGSYILTKDLYEEATATSPMFSLDCEMCMTTSGNLELTRISVVNESMNIIYDSLVKPVNAITNYLTRYSGITEEMLSDVTVTLHDVQQTLRKLLPPDAILVGQSLNSDLHILKMMHPYIIDTSVIFNLTGNRYMRDIQKRYRISDNSRTIVGRKNYTENRKVFYYFVRFAISNEFFDKKYRKTKLQVLAREFLGENIQSETGHCSAEDSRASMKLVKLKLAHSVDYGDAVLLGNRDMKLLKMKTEKERLSWQASQKAEIKKYATSIFSHVTKTKGSTAAIIGSNETISEYSKYLQNSSLNIMDDESFTKDDQVRLVIADTDKHAIVRASEIAIEHTFVLCHVKIKEEDLKDEQIEKTFRTINKWSSTLWEHSAVNSLVCTIFGGQTNVTNGACFLSIKSEILPDIVIQS